MSTTVQLKVLGNANVETCASLTLSWDTGSSLPDDSPFNLFVMRESDPSGTVTIGQGVLSNTSFRWLRVNVGPGSYIVNATPTASSRRVFLPTDPFTVFAGSDTSCVSSFNNSTASTESLPTTTGAPPTGPARSGSESNKAKTAIIAGAVSTGVILLFCLALVVWYWLRRRRHAPVAVRTRRSTFSSSVHSKAHSFSYTADLTPFVAVVPLQPLSQAERPVPATYPRPLPIPPSPPPETIGHVAQQAGYAESTVVSDDSFAEERDALRAEFQSSDGTISAGGRRNRPFSAIESSVGTDAGIGLDRMSAPAVPQERRPRQMTFAVSNPDHTVWEDQVYGPRR